jgi:uncharacterized protein YjbI with pentapeptide repeats
MISGQHLNPMANPQHLAKLKESVKAWNTWRSEYPDINVDLTRVDLRTANLRGANLVGADLTGTILYKADLSKADLSNTKLHRVDFKLAKLCGARFVMATSYRANLSGADLTGAQFNDARLDEAILYRANLTGVSFEDAHLDGADLTEANLNGANLRRSNLKGAKFWFSRLENADMTGVIVGDTAFGGVDLSTVRGLDLARHARPSIIGIDVIFLSQGTIPESFLRGCGVPDEFITYMRSLVANPIEFYSCFISYSTKDQAFADRLYADLQNKGVRCWFAPHDIQGGRKIHEQIDEAIRLHDKLLLILSPSSMKSEWVQAEIAKARKREMRDLRRVLFPIRLAPFETLRDWECFDADTGKDSAREIREYFIPDFSNWKNHDSYQEAFQTLIRDLKASDSKPK